MIPISSNFHFYFPHKAKFVENKKASDSFYNPLSLVYFFHVTRQKFLLTGEEVKERPKKKKPKKKKPKNVDTVNNPGADDYEQF